MNRLEDGAGARLPADALRDEDIARLLVGESRPLSAATRRELMSQRFSYFEDDLAVLTWNAALVVEPAAEDTDVQYVLEFANAQLLELRFDDALLDAEIPKIYTRVAEARRGVAPAGARASAGCWRTCRRGSPTPRSWSSGSRTRSRSPTTSSWRASTPPRSRSSAAAPGGAASTASSRSCATATAC